MINNNQENTLTHHIDPRAESGESLPVIPSSHSVPRVEYMYKTPPEVATVISALVEKWSWFTPPWCQDLYIGWDGGGRDDCRLMDCSISYRYRTVTIRIYGAFLDTTPQKREESFVHELCHSFVGVAMEFAEEMIDRLIPQNEAPKFKETARNELDARHEAAVQDLAFRIYQRFSNPNQADVTTEPKTLEQMLDEYDQRKRKAQ